MSDNYMDFFHKAHFFAMLSMAVKVLTKDNTDKIQLTDDAMRREGFL